MRIALYSHDSVGLGHVRRNLAIAGALSEHTERGTATAHTGIVITSQPSATATGIPAGWDWLVLPGITPGPERYVSRSLDLSPAAITGLRGALVQTALDEYRPDLLIIDRHPFGASGELTEAIQRTRARSPHTRIVLGLRDILDAPDRVAAEWDAAGGAEYIADHLDAVWVYGDPLVHDPVATGEIPPALAAKVSYTGYLSEGRRCLPAQTPSEPFILTTVGGGSDGYALADAMVQTPPPAGMHSLIITGPHMPAADENRLRLRAEPGITIIRQVPDALALMKKAEAIICMAGYNSVAEVLSTRVPALVVPRTIRRQEQRIRANAMASHGVITQANIHDLTPEAISSWLDTVLGHRINRTGIRTDGLHRLPALARALVTSTRSAPAHPGALHTISPTATAHTVRTTAHAR